MTLDDATQVEVCAACKCRCCWVGEFYCQDAKTAGVVTLTVAELRKLDLEHERYWARKD